mmetsp:Transcript_52283/g.113968  ORF Transcript_52283/g.113968 Transcript_52283/m.113968 type:complete len:1162 (-) Transcript_52283:57-3542(-)
MAEDSDEGESDEYEDDLEEEIVADEESEEEDAHLDGDQKEPSQDSSGGSESSHLKAPDQASGQQLAGDALQTFEADDSMSSPASAKESSPVGGSSPAADTTPDGKEAARPCIRADFSEENHAAEPASDTKHVQAPTQDELLDMASELRRGFTDDELVCLRPVISAWDSRSKGQLVALLSDPPLPRDFQAKIAQVVFDHSDWPSLEVAMVRPSTLAEGGEVQASLTPADGFAGDSECGGVAAASLEEGEDAADPFIGNEEHNPDLGDVKEWDEREGAESRSLQAEIQTTESPAFDALERNEVIQDLDEGDGDKKELEIYCEAVMECGDNSKENDVAAALGDREKADTTDDHLAGPVTEVEDPAVVADEQVHDEVCFAAGRQETEEGSVISETMWEAVALTEASSTGFDAPNCLDEIIHEAAIGSLHDVSNSPHASSPDEAPVFEGEEGLENPELELELELKAANPQVEQAEDDNEGDANLDEDEDDNGLDSVGSPDASEDDLESEVASDLSSEAARFLSTNEEDRERLELLRMTSEEESMKRHLQSQALWEHLTSGCSRSYLDERLGTFEGKVEPEVLEAQLREQAKQTKERKANAQVEALLKLMAIKGGGNITLAWRRYFDSDGDGELSFGEFCAALMDLGYGENQDLIVLWKDLTSRGDRPDADCITLEAIDPVGASILDSFGRWCKEVHGGPWELFRKLDEDGSDSLSADEFIEGLNEYGFFNLDYLPAEVASEELVLQNLFPLLDSGGCSCVTADQLLFLELDKDKRERIKQELKKAREEGTAERDLAPLTNDAQEMLHNMVMSTTNLGGKHWTTVQSEVAVGGPWGLELSFSSSPTDSTVGRTGKHTAGFSTLSSHGPSVSGQLSRRQYRLNTGSSTMTNADRSPRAGAAAQKTFSNSDEVTTAARSPSTMPSPAGLGQTSASLPTRTLPAKRGPDRALAASQPLLPSSRPGQKSMEQESSIGVSPSPSTKSGGPRPKGFDEFVAKRTKELPPLQTSSQGLDHYKEQGWGNGGGRSTHQKETALTTLSKSVSTSSLPPASRSPGNGSNGFTSSEKQDARRQCYRQSLVPALLPTIRKDGGAFGKTASMQGADPKSEASPAFLCATTGARFTGAGVGGKRGQSSRRAKEKLRFKPEICGHFLTSATAVGLFRHYGGDT